MRAIRIIKQKQNVNEATNDRSKKPDEPSTRKIANTVKSWIEESQQHRRNLPRSLTALGVLILIACTVAMGQSPDIKVRANYSTKIRLLRWPDGRVKQDQL